MSNIYLLLLIIVIIGGVIGYSMRKNRTADKEHLMRKDTAIGENAIDAKRSEFIVKDVFFIKNINKVIAAGVVKSGEFKISDEVIIMGGNKEHKDKIIGIDRMNAPGVDHAKVGDAVGLMLEKIGQDAVKVGDVIITATESQLKGVVRTNLDSPNPTGAQIERKKKNIEKIKMMGLPTIDHLPVVEDEKQIKPRTPDEVATRCIAIAFCALKGETKGKDRELIDKLIREYSAEEYFTPKEKLFISADSPSEQDFINFVWEYERLHVLLWALGKEDHLKAPNEVCDVASDVSKIREQGPSNFVSKAKLRPFSEILDMADYYYRLDWAAVELRLKGIKSDSLNEEIIVERHKALNWLISYLNQDWDDVTNDT